MKKIMTAALLLSSMGAMAQETYQDAEIATQDLNGTAKYVGMGGAMEALGADISAAGENPAALGLSRSGSVSATFGYSQQPNGGNISGDSKGNVNFDQIGVVLPMIRDYDSQLNLGFGYRKSTNFNQILNLTGATLPYQYDGKTYYGSQNTTTYEKYHSYLGDDAYTQVDYLYENTLMHTNDNSGDLGCYSASGYYLGRERKGYIGNYDIILSVNSHDRIYYGFGITISDVHYQNNSLFRENLLNGGETIGNVELEDSRHISGVGASLKGGIIFRPIEASPFRIGLSVETPTWYDLRTRNNTAIYNNTDYGSNKKVLSTGEVYEYEISTPWKFGLSAGTTFGRFLAIGASFNYVDYSSLKSEIKEAEGGRYNYYESAYNDRNMCDHTERSLKGVSTFKVGAEVRVVPEVAVRLGYNYVSPMYKEDAYKDITLDSPGTYYSSTTDYTNWKATNRFTAGLGFNISPEFSLDLAYQYSDKKGEFAPYCNINGNTPACSVDVNNKRHQALCTLTYRF